MSDLQRQMIEFATMDLVSAVAVSRKMAPREAMRVVYESPFFLQRQDPKTGLYREAEAYRLSRFNTWHEG